MFFFFVKTVLVVFFGTERKFNQKEKIILLFVEKRRALTFRLNKCTPGNEKHLINF